MWGTVSFWFEKMGKVRLTIFIGACWNSIKKFWHGINQHTAKTHTTVLFLRY